MRIITITSSTNRSGGTRQAIYQSKQFALCGHDITLCLPHDSSFWELPKDKQEKFWIPLPKKPSQQKLFIEELFSSNEPTIIHAFHNKAIKRIAWWGLSWLNKKKVKCVAHRGVIYRPRNPLPYLSPAIKAFIVNSQACTKALAWHCPKAKIHIIPNGIPKARITPTIDKTTALKKIGFSHMPTILFGFVGNNKPEKGFELLINAFKLANIPGAKILTLGIKTELWISTYEKLGIQNLIHDLGYVEHIADYLQLCDVFVLPSKKESAPNTLIEAICMGLPVVATNVGGVPELAKDSGILVPSNDIQALAHALIYMSKYPEKRKQWEQKNYSLCKNFSIISRCNTLESIYQSIIDTK